MNVKELKDYLEYFPDSAKVLIVVNDHPVKFEICYGGMDGGTKLTAENVSFMVEGTLEKALEEK